MDQVRPPCLDPEMRSFVEETERHYPPEASTWSVSQNRHAYEELCTAFRPPRPKSVVSEDGAYDLVSPERQVRYRSYRCVETSRDTTVVVLYMHGGGFILGGLESHDDVCAELCSRTGLDVVAVDYRLAPEHVYPAALDDVEGVHRALVLDGRRILVAGDSAGGTLAAALTQRLRRTGGPQPAGQVLVYPALGRVRTDGSYAQWADAPMLSAADCAYYIQTYGGQSARSHAGDPEFMPLVAHDFSGLPPAWVVSADVDPLRDDGRDFVAKLAAAGVAAEWRNEPGLVHGYLRARHTSERAAASFTAIVDAIHRIALRPDRIDC